MAKYRLYLCLSVLFLSVRPLFSQHGLPVVKAGSKSVAVRDGDHFDPHAWTLSPETKPDIFTADRTRKTKWVVFRTDIDSIRVKVKPGTRKDFVIVLNGRDSCLTRVQSAIPPETAPKKQPAVHDTIPFVLTEHNAICVKAVVNGTDTLNLHFDSGSFDFRFTKDAIRNKTGLTAGQTTPDYRHLAPVHTLQMGRMVWKDPEMVPTGLTAHGMDGRFGWNLFEGKAVEIDYDRSRLVIHSKPPKAEKGHAVAKIEFVRSFMCIKAVVGTGHKKYPGLFLLDTGADGAVILDSAWTAERHLDGELETIRTSVVRDPGGVKYETRIVRLPRLKIARTGFTNVPAHLLGGPSPLGFKINYLGNDLLKRFHTVIDLKHDRLYLKPNKQGPLPFKGES